MLKIQYYINVDALLNFILLFLIHMYNSNLSNNNISSIPKSIGNLCYLEKL